MTQGARDVATPLSIEGMQLRQRMTYIRADNRLIAVAVPASLRDEGCSRDELFERRRVERVRHECGWRVSRSLLRDTRSERRSHPSFD